MDNAENRAARVGRAQVAVDEKSFVSAWNSFVEDLYKNYPDELPDFIKEKIADCWIYIYPYEDNDNDIQIYYVPTDDESYNFGYYQSLEVGSAVLEKILTIEADR